MITMTQALSVMERFTYKQGWTICGVERDAETLVISVLPPKTQDAERPYAKIFVTHDVPVMLSRLDSELALVNLVRHAVLYVEEHEVNEWLRWDGKRVFPPHTRFCGIL